MVYVDDMIIAGDAEREKQSSKGEVGIPVWDEVPRDIKVLIGIEVEYSTQCIFISEIKYFLNLLKEIGKLGCNVRPFEDLLRKIT